MPDQGALSTFATEFPGLNFQICPGPLQLASYPRHHKADLAQACYSQEDIDTLSINWASLCSKCLQWGHQKIHCQARLICIYCSSPGHKVIDCPSRSLPKIHNSLINNQEKAIHNTGLSAHILPIMDRQPRPRTTA